MPRTAKRDRDAVSLGDTFGRWTVIGAYSRRSDGQAVFSCRCACGNERGVLFRNLGVNASCGCLQRERTQERRRIVPGRNLTRRELWIWNNYKLTPEDWDRLYDEQLGRCRICLVTLAEVGKVCVDHDHITGVVRGLLCHGCNVAIGHLKEDVEIMFRAIEYLLEHARKVG